MTGQPSRNVQTAFGNNDSFGGEGIGIGLSSMGNDTTGRALGAVLHDAS